MKNIIKTEGRVKGQIKIYYKYQLRSGAPPENPITEMKRTKLFS